MLRHLLVLFYLTLSSNLLAEPLKMPNDAFVHINAIRKAARMTPLTYSIALSRASQNHAAYLSRNVGKEFNNIDMHSEKRSHAGFTGKKASSRAKHIGYPYQVVKENISVGNKNSAASVSGLMAGIYHRFTFLDFLIDTIGYAASTNKTEVKTYVYNMGRKDMESVCTNHPEEAKPDKPVDCLGTTVNADYYSKLCADIPQKAVYEPPFSKRCPNGNLLKASYMETICQSPPTEILFNGEDSYYEICDPGIRVKASWMRNLCGDKVNLTSNLVDKLTSNPALHNGEERYYKICKSKTRVYAKWLKNICDSASNSDRNIDSAHYKNACHSTFKVNQTYLDTLDKHRYESNPKHVIWPPFEASEVTPVFFDEIPDPLPDLDVSGYPLSIQFNPGKVKKVNLSQFKLEKKTSKGKWRRIKGIREINHDSDPENIFSKLQYAWFPLQRLDWNTQYRASIVADIDGNEQLIHWLFKTRSVDTPLLKIKSRQTKLYVPEGRWFTLYLAPSKRLSRPMKKTSFKWRGPAKIESKIIDFNTIKIKLKNTLCQSIYLQISRGRKLTLNTCRS